MKQKVITSFIDYSSYNKPATCIITKAVDGYYICSIYTIPSQELLNSYKIGKKQLLKLLIMIIYKSKLVIDNLIKDNNQTLLNIKGELNYYTKKDIDYYQVSTGTQIIHNLANGDEKTRSIMGIAIRHSDVVIMIKSLKLNKIKNNLSVIKQIKFRRKE